MSSVVFTVEYYDYYGHLVTATLSEPTISTTIPSITYAATYSQVGNLFSPSLLNSTESTGNSILVVVSTTLVDTGATTDLEIVVLPTSPQAHSHSQLATETPQGSSNSTNPANSATTTPAANPSQSPVAADGRGATSGLHSGAIVGIAIGATLVVLFVFALWWYLVRRRRRHADNQSAALSRAESKGYKKAELECTTASGVLGWSPKPELAVNEEILRDGAADISSRIMGAAGHTDHSSTHQELEAASTPNPWSQRSQIESSEPTMPATQQLEGLVPMTSSGSAQPREEFGLLKQSYNNMPSPKHTPATHSSPREQAAVDASQLAKLKAQERELAEYIEAHETLQKLKNEHIALRERIKAAEGRARRSKTGDLG